MADRFYTSGPVETILNDLRQATGLEYATLARLALAHSLRQTGKQVPASADFKGKELRWISVLGDDEALLCGLAALVHGHVIPAAPTPTSPYLLKDHVDSGAQRLWALYLDCARDATRFLETLAGQIELPAGSGGTVSALDLTVGSQQGQERVVFALNDTAAHPNPHLALAGKPGVGKTQLLLKMLADLREQSEGHTHFILFDYKGDIAANRRFLELAGASLYSLPEHRLPINPFLMDSYGQEEVLLSAREKAESFASINAKLGVVQKGILTQGILRAHEKRRNHDRPYPDFVEVLSEAQTLFEEEGRREDTLIEVLRDLAQFKLFWDHSQADAPLTGLTQNTFVVDLHQLPVLKELVAYLVIERLYKEMAALPDSRIEQGRRELRTVLVIDEAHNYLPQRNPFLERVVREGRSKGVAVFLASQSASDYHQRGFDFRELLEFLLLFKSDGLSAPELQELLGCSAGAARDLQARIPNLPPYEAVAKAPASAAAPIRFRTVAFHEAYA